MAHSILLGDDHSLVLQTLKEFIELKIPMARITATEDFSRFVSLLNSNKKFDLAIIDFKMPGITGVSTIKSLIKNSNKIPVAVLSGLANHSEIIEFMQFGAVGYIPKTVSGIGLVNAINLMLGGEKFIPSTLITDSASSSNGGINLTPREMDILRKLHLGYSNKEIGRRLNIEEITVKVYVSRLCRKLNAKNRTQIVVEALSRGIIS